jgi:hypothetical protein
LLWPTKNTPELPPAREHQQTTFFSFGVSDASSFETQKISG